MRDNAMRRIRPSTLMLLIVIAALGIGLIVQDRRAARREAELNARLAQRGEFIERIMPLVKQLQSQRSVIGNPGIKEVNSK
jgi:hypothetical protein